VYSGGGQEDLELKGKFSASGHVQMFNR
jgi:hypothetical protein